MAIMPKHSVSVAAVIRDESGKVLVIRRADNGHWEIPGGVLELDEAFDLGVQREVEEETGLQVTVDSLSGAYKNLVRGIVALVFRCTPVAGSIQATDEAIEVCWMTREEVAAVMDPAFAIRVFDAFEPGAAYRAHNGVELSTSLQS